MSDKKQLIQPRTLKGFRDFPPALAMPREQMIDAAKAVFRSYGFAPIDTPALEYSEILTGKGGEESDKQMYRFTDHGGRDVALRFDLTVPFARFAAQHAQQLGLPFKRYHVGPVWRGENTQKGRYREFYQCDFDTIGTDSNTSDIETALIIHDILAALGFERFKIHVNNRKILSGLLETLGLSEQATPVLRALDKLAKIGADKVAAEMASAGLSDAQAAHILQAVQTEGSNRAVLDQLGQQLSASERAMEGVADLRQLADAFEAAHIPEDRLRVDVSVARGLDYYTGVIYEMVIMEGTTRVGSIAAGGRYDNLVGMFSVSGTQTPCV
ncbi:MAG: histidine--tRNA ligase, partial [Candidatus Latescibacterota bacterium]|nr:histidine--tRNA ligase [Candidatus Latescibacterota bacterium]